MRKAQKKQIMDFAMLLEEAHDELKEKIKARQYADAIDILCQCQQGAIQMGELIEQLEGEDVPTVSCLESYCELIFQVHESISQGEPGNENKIYKSLRKSLIRIENSIKNDIKVRLEIVFLPYKASMWDSLESVWKASDADSDCDAYVVPIPYYDRKPDGSFGTLHYEGTELPSYVPTLHYESYSFEKRKPDIVFIHNPYDNYNYVTSVDPRFYSGELKKHTECLVYIPYYSTTGGMSEGQMSCPAYYNADYIVIQAPKYRKFFDAGLPDEKFLPLGSPKFDRVIQMCKEPKCLPDEWKDKAEGKKLYFYNTSIGGMLQNTENFLKKMEYVFRCFDGREDACIVWRPHPLLESTFESMRAQYYPFYKELKRQFIENGIGIYDDTPDITSTIAVCDAYIGDSGTSVTSLFGVAGKPMFILNNRIHTEPEEDDWKGEIIKGFYADNNEWLVTPGNQLYYAPNNDYRYEHYCSLSEYSSGNYFLRAIEVNGKVYACPGNAQEILVIGERKIEKRILLERCLEQGGAFAGAMCIGNYLYLIPNKYPAIVRYDTVTEQLEYIRGFNDVFIRHVNGEKRIGGNCIYGDSLFLASPADNYVLEISSNGKIKLLTVKESKQKGCFAMLSDGESIWMMPNSGNVIVRWNPDTEEVQEYSDLPYGFMCKNMITGAVCKVRPFNIPAFGERYVVFPPYWGNMYVRLDKKTGQMEEWKPTFPMLEREKSGYYTAKSKSYFACSRVRMGKRVHQLFSICDRKLYDVNEDTDECQEVMIDFNLEELKNHEPGFCKNSDWLIYACQENAFNTLRRFLNDDIIGNVFSKEQQIAAYGSIVANNDGSSGEKVHEFIKNRF